MQTVDKDRAEAFAERLVGVLDGASLALLISVGYRAGLFEALAGLGPATSIEVARAAALDERYVREWLGGMVVGSIVDYDPAARTYELPPEHAAFTTQAAGPDNLAFFTQYYSLMGTVEPEIVRVFREGGGVPYSSYTTLQTLQRDETATVQIVVRPTKRGTIVNTATVNASQPPDPDLADNTATATTEVTR